MKTRQRKCKRLLAAVLITMLGSIMWLSACHENQEYILRDEFRTEEYLPDFDMQFEYDWNSPNRLNGICREDNIYYFADGMNQFIYFYEEESQISGKLCGKPECNHDDRNCNAYIGRGEAETLQIYDGKLYFVGEGGVLYRMNLDGTERENVMSLRYGNSNLGIAIHRDYVYAEQLNVEMEKGVQTYTTTFYQYVLGDEESAKELYTWSSTQGFVRALWILRANRMYIIADYQMLEEGPYKTTFIQYNVANGEEKILYEAEGSSLRPETLQMEEEGFSLVARDHEAGQHQVYYFDFDSEEWTDVFQYQEAEPTARLAIGEKGYISYFYYVWEETAPYVYIDEAGDIQKEGVFPGDGGGRTLISPHGRDEKGNLFTVSVVNGIGTLSGQENTEQAYWIRITPEGELEVIFHMPDDRIR